MPNAEMYAIEVQDAPVFLQRTLAPRLKLLGEALVEATDCAGTGRDSQQGLCHFSYLMGTGPSHEHLGESLGDVRIIATVALKGLRVELTGAVSRHVELLKPTSRATEVAGIEAIAEPFALRARRCQAHSNALIVLFPHLRLGQHPQRAL